MEASSDHTGERGALSLDEGGGRAGSWSSRNPQEEGASCVDSLVTSEETPPRGPCLRPSGLGGFGASWFPPIRG